MTHENPLERAFETAVGAKRAALAASATIAVISAIATVASVLSLASSCGSDLFGALSRSADDPSVVPPRAYSMERPLAATVRWDADEAADSFVLERRQDTEGSRYAEVYRGTDTEFAESLAEGRYFYRLTKVRGERAFGPSRPTFAVSSPVTRDEYEPDDEVAAARPLESAAVASLYYFRGSDGQTLSDVDWYRVTLPPRSVAFLSLTDYSIEGGEEDTHFASYRAGLVDRVLHNMHPFEIENDANVRRDLYFAIKPNAVKFIPTVESGGSVIAYKLIVERIELIGG